MAGLGNLLGILGIKEMRGRPRQAEAREMLEKLRDQVHPICVAHKWKVGMLEEFMPSEAGLLGLNMNRGMKIKIRLRPPSDEGSFIPFESALDTLLHELVHNEISPHSAKFFKKWDELRAECEKLMREGITGRNMPFAGDGQSLGGGLAPADARAAALKAAEKRKRQQGVMPCGGQRLGGGDGGGGGLWGAGSGSVAQRAAAAAQRRAEISRGCGNRPAQDDRGAADSSVLDWECPACTLINPPVLPWCDACGGPRSAAAPAPAPAPAPATGASGGGSDSSGRLGARAGGASAGVSGGREKRPAPATGAGAAGAARASKAAGVHRTAGARAASGRSLGGAGSSGGGGGGLSGLRTWTCHECPFRFPNAEERRTCETCGASRDAAADAAAAAAAKKQAPGSSSNSSGSGGGVAVSVAGGRGWEKEVPPWTCGRCTVVNAGMFLFCGTCEAERPVEGQAPAANGAGGGWTDAGGWAATQSGGTAELSSAGGGTGGESLGAPAVGEDSGSKAAPVARVCRVCTLRNVSEASECVACGIPFAESEAAAAAMAGSGGSGGNGGGGSSGEVLARDGSGSDGPLGGGEGGAAAAAAAAAAAPSTPECIDLS